MVGLAEFTLDDIYTWIDEMVAEKDDRESSSAVADLLFLFGVRLPRRARRRTHTYKQIVRMLDTADKRAIGPLLLALSLPIGNLRPVVIRALTRLLRSLQKGDNLDSLGPFRWRLFRALEERNPHQDSLFQLAILHAFETCGTDDDIFLIRALAPLRYNTNVEQDIVNATHRCLVTIREREDRTRVRHRLLRSTADQKDPAELLRSVPVSPYHEPEKLLRTAVVGAQAVDPTEV